jgi:hypothetical protein
LTGTIEHLCIEEGPSLALICSDPGDPHAWIHLRCFQTLGESKEWLLTAGFPFFEEPKTIFDNAGIALPATTLLSNYEYGIFLTLTLHEATEARDIALLISKIMFRLQQMTNDAAIEIALEDN